METSRTGMVPQSWSPLSCRVVEITQEGVPVPVRPQPSGAPGPLGYRVVMVADQKVPASPRPSPPRARAKGRPDRRQKPQASWFPLAGGVVFTVAVVIFMALAMAASVRTTLQEDFLLPPGVPVADNGAGVNAFQAVVPKELAGAAGDVPVQEAKAGPPVEDNKCVPAKEPGGRETFGTSVEFVRNTQEAGRLAAAEHKLAFHLHVSGNFEDRAFT